MNGKKLSVWAKGRGVHYRTALTWVREGTMPVATYRTPGGHVRVLDEAPAVNQLDRIEAKIDRLLEGGLA